MQVIEFIADYRPDEVIQAGTILDDVPQNRATHQSSTEHRRAVLENAERAKATFLSPIRRAHRGLFGVLLAAPVTDGSNSDQALALSEPRVQDLLEFERFRMRALPSRHQISDGWMVLRDDGMEFAHSDIPGNTALNIAKHLRSSVIVGHTGRLGKGSRRVTYETGEASTLTGIEAGTLVSGSDSAFATSGIGRWQQGFVALEINERGTQSSLYSFRGRQRSVARMSLVA